MKKKFKLLAGLVLLIFCVNIACGYLNRTGVVEKQLIMSLPKNSKFLSFVYSPFGFKAIISCDEDSFQYFESKFYEGASYEEYTVCYDTVKKESIFQGDEIQEIRQFYAAMSSQNISVVLCRLRGETRLYVYSPIPEVEAKRLFDKNLIIR